MLDSRESTATSIYTSQHPPNELPAKLSYKIRKQGMGIDAWLSWGEISTSGYHEFINNFLIIDISLEIDVQEMTLVGLPKLRKS